MSIAVDHHYLSQFHLRKWRRPDEKVTRWARIEHSGKLVPRPVSTAGTAYLPGLYSLLHVGHEETQQIEREFDRMEDKSKPVLEKLIGFGPQALSVEERYWWTRYLHAAILRVPHIVQRMKRECRQIVRHDFTRDHHEFLAAKGDAPERTLLEWAEIHSPESIENSGLRVLVDMLNDEDVIDRIIHLRWIVKDVSASRRPLLIGDNPVERVGDLHKPQCLISIPLAPTHVFFGTDSQDVIRRITEMPARAVVNASNISILSSAKKFAYGEAEHSFVNTYLAYLASATGE